MKEKIKEYLQNECVIILDTNSYLNIYDRSPEFSDFSIKTLETIKNFIVLPSTVLREFQKNHAECHGRQVKKIINIGSKLKQQLNTTKDKIRNQCKVIKSFQFPDIDELESLICNKIEEIGTVLDDYYDEHNFLEIVNEKFIEEDRVKELFENLIENNQILPPFTLDQIYSLAETADKRYAEKRPPGFKDDTAKRGKEGLNLYGDYFIWIETIRFAKLQKKDIVFVTDDGKTDWWQITDDGKFFNSLLISEFAEQTGQSILGISSYDFLISIADFAGIEITPAVLYAFEYSAETYVNGIVENGVFDEIVTDLIYSDDKYVDTDSLERCGSENFDLSDDIDSDKVVFKSYEYGGCSDNTATYYLTFQISIDSKSYEYYGRDDETKEVILSDGRIHCLKGDITIKVTRKIDTYIDIEDYSYEKVEIYECLLSEVESYDVGELCVQCGQRVGEYSNNNDEPICDECMVVDEHGEICTHCGRKMPFENMYDGSYCYECFQKLDN